MSMVAAAPTLKKRPTPSSCPASSPHPSPRKKRRSVSSLPISSCEGVIVAQLKLHDVLIIVGETASGKTTQIPQYILRNTGLVAEGRCVAITQPRRLATIALARRVASEVGCKVGGRVGYSVRFQEKMSASTQIKFLTDGMLLREAVSRKNLKKYSVIIVDEAHERTINTDVLFGLLKKIQAQRCKTPLKLIIMSATLDADSFSRFFNAAKVLYIQGREYPIQTLYTAASQSDYLHSSIVTVLQIHQDRPPAGDILVFLTGQEEIEEAHRILVQCNAVLPSTLPQLAVYCLFGALPTAQQVGVFTPAPRGSRKVVLSTNIAETSLTIPGVKYVVDSCRVKQKHYSSKVGLESLQVRMVSKSTARQRQGRSGREGPGVCYRLCTEAEYSTLPEVDVPEIQRVRLTSVILTLLNLGIRDVTQFSWVDKPPQHTITLAVRELIKLGAVTRPAPGDLELTPTGRDIARFPLSPHLARMVLLSRDLSCTAEVVTLVSLLSVDGIYYTPHNKQDIAVAVRSRFKNPLSDHVTLIRVYKSAVENHFSKEWCERHYLNHRALQTACSVRRQLKGICKRVGVQLITNKRWEENVVKALLYGYLDNIATRQPDHSYRDLASQQQCKIHPSSVLAGDRGQGTRDKAGDTTPVMVLYSEMVLTSETYLRGCSVVDSGWYQHVLRQHTITEPES